MIETSGPRAFCPREHVLAIHSRKVRTRGKISPARALLFATGHAQHEYVVNHIIQHSPYAGAVYANWSCTDWTSLTENEHPRVEGTLENVFKQTCKCGKPYSVHHEVDLVMEHLLLTGHPDLLFLYDRKFHVHEIKTMERADISFDDLTTPLASHRLQVSFYYKMLQPRAEKLGMKVSRNLVIDYVDRSNSKLFGGNPYKPLTIKPEADDLLQPFRNRLLHVVQGAKTKKLPERICNRIDCTRARQCDLAVECFSRRNDHVVQIRDWSGPRAEEHSRVDPRQHAKNAAHLQHKDENRSAARSLRRLHR